MDRIRKIICSCLTFCMLISMLPVTTLATEVGEITSGEETALSLPEDGTMAVGGEDLLNEETDNGMLAEEAPHEHTYSYVTTAPTCTEQGYTTYTCTCGDSYVDTYVDAAGHSFAEGTCTACGEADPDYAAPDDGVVASGTCRNNLTWELTNDGVLTISGTGNISYSPPTPGAAPWYDYLEDIQMLKVESGITGISWRAFLCYPNLVNVELSDTVESIGESAFTNCSGLVSVTMSDSVTTIGSGAFDGCDSLNDLYYGGNAEQWKAISIGANNDGLMNVIIHFGDKSYATVGGYCGDDAFWTLSETGTFTVTGTGAMYDYDDSSDRPWDDYKSSITSVVIEEGITEIGYQAFYWCKELTNVELPDGLEIIGDSAFEECEKLNEITIPDGVTKLGSYAFGATGLTSINIPGSVETIGYGAFAGCDNLAEVTLQNGIKEIADKAFAGCPSLTSVTIPASVTSIGTRSFNKCERLVSINVAEENTAYSGVNCALLDKDMQTLLCVPGGYTGTYTIPDGVKTIAEYAFAHCTNITAVTISESVTTIGTDAFSGCTSLTSVTIPLSVTQISDGAFWECTALSDVYYAGSEEKWGSVTIEPYNDCLTNATIHFAEEGSHAHTYSPVITAPTCTEQGYTTYTCTCGDSYVDTYVDAAGHSFGEWNEIKAATEDAEGEEQRDCANCDAYETRTTEKLTHAHSYTPAVTAPTCTEQGYTTYTCECGDSYISDEVAALGHAYDEGIVTTEPGCETEGVKTFTCANDETHTYTETVEGTGHNFVAGICSKCGGKDPDYSGSSSSVSSSNSTPIDRLKDILKKLYKKYEYKCSHEYSITVIEPSCESTGYTLHTCTKCGNEYKDSYTAPVGHDYENNICTVCGNTNPNWKNTFIRFWNSIRNWRK